MLPFRWVRGVRSQASPERLTSPMPVAFCSCTLTVGPLARHCSSRNRHAERQAPPIADRVVDVGHERVNLEHGRLSAWSELWVLARADKKLVGHEASIGETDLPSRRALYASPAPPRSTGVVKRIGSHP